MRAISIATAAICWAGFFTSACSSNPDKSELTQQVLGKYASETENEFDYFRYTLEIKSTDDGKLDIIFLARWSAAKEDDPQRPVNKVAGVWNNHGKGKTLVGELQASDTTLRISEPLDGSVTIIPVSLDDGTISWPQTDGETETFVKIDR